MCYLSNKQLIRYEDKEDRWRDFYSYFTTRKYSAEGKILSAAEGEKYDFVTVLIGLVALSNSHSTVKSLLLSELLTN